MGSQLLNSRGCLRTWNSYHFWRSPRAHIVRHLSGNRTSRQTDKGERLCLCEGISNHEGRGKTFHQESFLQESFLLQHKCHAVFIVWNRKTRADHGHHHQQQPKATAATTTTTKGNSSNNIINNINRISTNTALKTRIR